MLKFAEGTYVGNGTTQDIAVPFDDVRLVVDHANDATNSEAMFISDTMSLAQNFEAATQNASITLGTGQFTVTHIAAADGRTNELGKTYYWAAWGGDDLVTGQFTGTGSSNPRTGLGIAPLMTWVKRQGTILTYFRTADMGASSFGFTTTGEADEITSLDADGFTLGTSAEVNTNGAVYDYIAFAAAPNFATGSFAGNSTDNRDLPASPMAFDPSFTLVKQSGALSAVYKPLSLAGDATLGVTAGVAASNRIQSLTPAAGQFQVGTNNSVNLTATTYFWFAFGTLTGGPIALEGSIDSEATLSASLTVILGPDSLVAIQKRGVMRSGIWVVGQSPPFPLIREIRTAVNVDRIKPLDEPGRLSFDISPREGEAPHDYATAGGSNLGNGLHLPPDLIREGAFLVDFSSELVEPWLWYIQTIAYDSDRASVQAVEVRGLLAERTLPEGSSFGSKGAAAVANVLLAQANGRNPTYIVPGSSSALRVVIPTGQATDFSRQNVLSAFDALAAFAAGDWWVAYAVSRSGIRPTLMLGKRGSDKRGEVVLTEGVELKAVSYARDAREVPRFVRFVQDSQGPAGGMATESAVGYRTGGQVQLAPEFHLRRALRKHGPALSAEQLRVYPQNTTDITLVGAALRSLQTSEAAVQTVELTLRQPPERFDVGGQPLANSQARTPWSAFGLGDTITARLSSPQFFAGVDVVLRITALQPDEAAGEMILVGDIVE